MMISATQSEVVSGQYEALSQNRTNFAIAQLIQAQIELQFEAKGLKRLSISIGRPKPCKKSIVFSRERRQTAATS